MVRRYEEPIEVRATADETVPGGTGTPEAFVWRGRLYVVREVLDHWKERRPWWREAFDGRREAGAVASAVPTGVTGMASSAPSVLGDARERQVWRVEASAGRLAGTGVYDLGADQPRQWRLLRVAD